MVIVSSGTIVVVTGAGVGAFGTVIVSSGTVIVVSGTCVVTSAGINSVIIYQLLFTFLNRFYWTKVHFLRQLVPSVPDF